MFIHYLVQYLILKLIDVPITKFRPMWSRIDLVYAPIQFSEDFAVVFFGIIANCLVFLMLYAFAVFTKARCRCFPKQWYKVLSYYGLYAYFDPFIVLTLDTVTGNWENGDYFKFYHHYQKTDSGGTGAVGAYITFFMVFMLSVCTGYVFYRYMVFVFMDGRILDLYRRLSGQYNTFFMPLDHEVSIKYLQWVVMRAKKKNCVISSSKEEAKDKYGNFMQVSFMKIFKIENDGLKFNRMFFKDFDGALREVPQKRIWLNDIELNKLLECSRKMNAAVYGDVVQRLWEQCDESKHQIIKQLCINTQRIVNNDAMGDVKTQLAFINQAEGKTPQT